MVSNSVWRTDEPGVPEIRGARLVESTIDAPVSTDNDGSRPSILEADPRSYRRPDGSVMTGRPHRPAAASGFGPVAAGWSGVDDRRLVRRDRVRNGRNRRRRRTVMGVAAGLVLAGLSAVIATTGRPAVGPDGTDIVAGAPRSTASTAPSGPQVASPLRPDIARGPGVVIVDGDESADPGRSSGSEADGAQAGAPNAEVSSSVPSSVNPQSSGQGRSAVEPPTEDSTIVTPRPTAPGSVSTPIPTSVLTSSVTSTSGRPTTTARSTSSVTEVASTSGSTGTGRPTTTTGRTSPGIEIWRDDFDTLDAARWRLEHSTYGDGNNELQCYRPGNVSVGGGRLVLRAVAETYTCPNGRTRQVTSGMVRSRGVSFSPGQAIEFRVRLTPADPDDQGGLWPAVWASSFGPGAWPAGGELDFLEVMTAENPRRAMFSMHYAGPSGGHELQNRGVIGTDYFSADWHTIRFEYGHDGVLVWYLDGREGFRVERAETSLGYPAPFDRTINEIRINLALGGSPGPLAAGALGSTGATFEVDYIRVLTL